MQNFCPKCGAKIEQKDDFYSHCGANISKDTIKQEPIIEKEEEEAIVIKKDESLPELVQRNYIIWLLLTLLSGLFNIVYMLILSGDMNNLLRYNAPTKPIITKIDIDKTVIVLLICYITIFFAPVGIIYGYYNLYQKLYTYIENDLIKQKNKPVSTRDFIALSIIQYSLAEIYFVIILIVGIFPGQSLLIFIIIASCIFPISIIGIRIGLIVYQYRWQEAFNERVRIINPNAKMVDFL